MKTEVGLFPDYHSADRAYAALMAAGFSDDEVSVLARETVIREVSEDERSAGDVAEGAGVGALAGGAAGGLIGVLATIGAIAIPGLGPIVAVGGLAVTLNTILGGTAVGAAVGGITGAMLTLGTEQKDVDLYAEGVKRGGVLVLIRTEDARTVEASRILQDAGAMDIHRLRRQWEAQGWEGYDASADPEADYPPLTIEDMEDDDRETR